MNKFIKIGIGILSSLIPGSFLYAMESFDTAWEKTFELVDRIEAFSENDYTKGTLEGNIILTGEGNDISKISVGFESDIKTEGKDKRELNIDFGVRTVSESEGKQSINGKVNLLTDDGDFYIRLDRIDAFDTAEINQFLDLYRNKWIKFSLKDYFSSPELTVLIDEYQKVQGKNSVKNISFKDCLSNITSTTYRGEFSQYRGDSAYQFTIDWEKVFDLYEFDDQDVIIQAGTGYLILDGTERIFGIEGFELVSDHGDVQKHSIHLGTNGFYWSVEMEDTEMMVQIKEMTEEEYEVIVKVEDDNDVFEAKGTLQFDVTKDKIDLSLNFPFGGEKDTSVHGEVNYEYHMQKTTNTWIVVPTESIDFMELYMNMMVEQFKNGETSFDRIDQEEQSDLSSFSSYPKKYIDAYQWAYSKGITTMKTIDEANMYNEVKRAEMAKMIGQFAKTYGNLTEDYSKNCNFKDGEVGSDLTEWIKTSCRLGIMGQDGKGGTNEYFNPNSYVSRAEFGTILSRILRGDLYDGGEPYYQRHIENLQNQGIMDYYTSPFINEKRGDIMVMLQYSYVNERGIFSHDNENKTYCNGEKINENYYFKNLTVKADIQKDGTVDVNEIFDANFCDYKHGIFRNIPLKYTTDGRKFRIFLDDINVDGKNFSVSESNGEKVIKIGDANKNVIGDQRYSIHYSVYGLIKNFAGLGREELNWNVIPNGFDTQIDQVRVELNLPKKYTGFTSDDFLIAADGKSTKVEDFQGTIDWSKGDKIILTYDKTIPAGKGISLAIKFPVGYFTFDHEKQKSLIDN